MALPTHIDLQIVTPDRLIVHEQVDEIQIPGSEGYFGVLPGHTPLLAALAVGEMWYRKGTETTHAFLDGGFAEVVPDRVSILAQVAERAEDLDQARAEAGMKRAEEQLGAVPHEIDWERSRLALLQTLQQLQAESRRRV